MNINVFCRIAMGIYKHQEDPNIQVCYRSKKIWVKGPYRSSRWKEYTFKQMMNEVAPNNEYLIKLIGE